LLSGVEEVVASRKGIKRLFPAMMDDVNQTLPSRKEQPWFTVQPSDRYVGVGVKRNRLCNV
jgi:hypothetical protein